MKRPFRPSTSRKTRAVLLAMALIAAILLGMFWRLTVWAPGDSFVGTPRPLNEAQRQLSEELKSAVRVLALDIGERHLRTPENLARTLRFLEESLKDHAPSRHTFEVDGIPCHNLEVTQQGTSHADEIVIFGAHYDSAHGTPGANDNGSGVAVLLAIARRSREMNFRKTVRFVWFTNEEPPHFQGPNMGSVRYVERSQQRGEHIVAMLSLETLGYFTNEPGSQKYPFPLGLVYPETGNFLAFVGNTASRSLVHQAVAAFRADTEVPSEAATLDASIPGVGWSDHWAFWQHGIPSLMVTDTAPFRYPFYHHEGDAPNELDYATLARTSEGLLAVLTTLANTDE